MNFSSWRVRVALLTAIALAISSGCEVKPVKVDPGAPATSPPPTATGTPPATPPGPPPMIPGPPTPLPAAPALSPLPNTPESPAAESPAPATPPDPPATPTETVKADVGVAQAGRSLDKESGVLVQPAKTYFAIREKAVFQIAIPGAYNLYKAENETPLTFDEFKEKVLDPNKIKLPPLPPGHTYEWDPETEQLNVRRPTK